MRALALAGALALLSAVGCSDRGGVGGVVGEPIELTTTAPVGAAAGAATTAPASGPTTHGPATSGVPAPQPSTPTAAAPATTATAGGLRLGGEDLGVTRLGAPFRQAVGAVSAVLGPPSGDPPPDTACIGAEDETAWGSFRLADSGGLVSGWRSTSTTLSTPAGVTVGTTVAALGQAYGARLQVRPPPEPDNPPVFVVDGIRLGGTLSGAAPSGTVTSLFTGTCEAA